MKKLIAMVPALALMMSVSVFAGEGDINSETLKAMGLSGMTAMSDDAGMSVRGMGFTPMKRPKHKSIAKAWGNSYASIGGGGEYAASSEGFGGGPSAATQDGFLAKGSFYASGEHRSEAGMTLKHSESKRVNGNVVKKTTVRSITVYAGGYSSASAF